MDELAQHIISIAATSSYSPPLPEGVSATAALVAARVLLEMSEDDPSMEGMESALRNIGRAVDCCDRALLELA